MGAAGILKPRESEMLARFLRGGTLEDIAEEYCLTRERVRQVVEKAIRKSRDISVIADRIKEAETLKAENASLTANVEALKGLLSKYEDAERDSIERERCEALCRLFSVKIADTELSRRVKNSLHQMGLRTVGDVCKIGKLDIMKQRNFGYKSLCELNGFLESIGLDYYMDVDRFYARSALLSKT